MPEAFPPIAESPDQLAELLGLEKHWKRRQPLEALKMIADADVSTSDAVAEKLGVTVQTVNRWLDRYSELGIAAFSDRPLTPARLLRVDTTGRSPSGGQTIMLGEADDLVASIVEAKLRKEGLQVSRARDGLELVASAERVGASLFLIDIRLSGLDGFQIARWIREHETLSATPIVMLGWPGKETDVVDAFNAGADDFLLKPFSPIELAARIGRLIKRDGIAA